MPTLQSHARHLRKNMTIEERSLWAVLRDRCFHDYKFRRQMVIGSYVVDFVCLEKRLIVELDGRGHLDQQEYDERRTKWLHSQGFRLVRFWNAEMEEDPNKVMQTILARLREAAPSPPDPLSRKGRVGEDFDGERKR